MAFFNTWLLATSLLLALLVAITALSLAGRLSAAHSGLARLWLVGGAIGLGIGLWSTNFIGTLAFSIPVPPRYDFSLTLFSFLVAVVTSTFAIWVASRPAFSLVRSLIGALVVGGGISLMHTCGERAIESGIPLHHSVVAEFVSTLAVVATAIASFRLAFTLRSSAERHFTRQEVILATTSRMGNIGGWEMELGWNDKERVFWSDVVYEIHELTVDNPPSMEAMLEFYPPQSRGIVRDALRNAFANQQSFDLILPFTTAKGRQRWVRIIGEPQAPSGQWSRIVGATQDVTTSCQAEEALRLAKNAAESASRSKSAFLANMSHEIRTPLTGVIGMTGLLLDSELTPQQREHAEIAQSSGNALLSLISDILDFSKIEAGHLELESIEFDCHELLEDAISTVALRAAEKGLELALEIEPTLCTQARGDPTRLRQVLLNLLSNAIKFTAAGEVCLRVAAQAGSDSDIEIECAVSDTGIGIMPDRINSLFAPFIQADDSTTRRFGGTGLGLSISKYIVEAMGGTIEVDSVYGSGSTFRFKVRLQTAAQAGGVSRSLNGIHVLVVEPHRMTCRHLEQQLSRHGCRITARDSARGGLDAYRALADSGHAPHIVLISQRLQDESCQWLASSIRQSGIPSPFLALLAPFRSRTSAAETSAFHNVINVPVKTRTLVESIESIARSRQSIAVSIPPAAAKVSLSGIRVLLAEDNVVNQKLVSRLLQRAGALVQLAGDGSEALRALAEADFDVVLMDCQMPNLDGYEATRQLRASTRNANIPVVALTAHAMATDRAKCLQAGMSDYLTKPVDPVQLSLTLGRLVGQASAAADPEAHSLAM